MSIVQKLTEGIVRRDMAQEGQALLDKWSATGLLEGIDTEHGKSTMARLLENQAKELLRESTSMTAGAVEGFAAVAFPIVRRVFAGLIANDLVSVQPMSLPSGLIFFLDFLYSGDLAGTESAQDDRMGNVAGRSIYGTNQVGSQITGGVDLVGSLGENIGGLRENVGYAYASPTGSGTLANDEVTVTAYVKSTMVSAGTQSLIRWDPDLLADADVTHFLRVTCAVSDLDSALDLDNLSAIDMESSGSTALSGLRGLIDTTGTGGDDLVEAALDSDDGSFKLIRRLTSEADGTLTFWWAGNTAPTTAHGADMTESNTAATCAVSYPVKDGIDTDGNDSSKGAIIGFNYPLEGNEEIPEIDIKVDQVAITAQTKKLKAKWTPELGQDLNAYHNLDAEVELTSILSEQIALEIDREILADLVNGATAGVYYWSRSPGLFVNRVTGAEIGASAAAPDFTGTVSEWYETLVETMNDISAQIHRKTLRGGANFCVVSPEVANILEFTSGFRANVTADADKGMVGAVKAGSLSRKWDVIVDPYFPRNVVLMGRKGASFLESGYVYAPYVPLQTTPTIFGPEDFVPRKGVMTRYAKKMVRPDMYGLVVVRGLLGEGGG